MLAVALADDAEPFLEIISAGKRADRVRLFIMTVRFIIDNRNPDITFITPTGNDFNDSFTLNITIENYNLTISNFSISNSTALASPLDCRDLNS